MKAFRNWLNFCVASFGGLLLAKLLFTYDNPIPTGCLWIGFVAIKALLDIFDA